MTTVHATCVAVDGTGVLLRGASGAGKSDLALRLIDAGAVLVSDDYTRLEALDGALMASAPETIRGLLEVRGLGVVRVPCQAAAPLGLIVDLVAPETVERLPEPEAEAVAGGIAVRRVRLAPFEASAAAKVRLAVRDGRGR
jgi:HPr kinase/phosphorylase